MEIGEAGGGGEGDEVQGEHEVVVGIPFFTEDRDPCVSASSAQSVFYRFSGMLLKHNYNSISSIKSRFFRSPSNDATLDIP